MIDQRADRELQWFGQELDRWGGDLAAWPAEDRRRAAALLERSAEARRHAEAARRVETALTQLMSRDAWPAPVRAVPTSRPSAAGRMARWGMVGVAASLLVGFVAGTLLPLPDDEDASRTFIAADDGDTGPGGLL